MYANNLFTLNNISTLSAVQGGFGVENRSESEYAVGIGDRLFVTVVQCGRTVFDSVFCGVESIAALMSALKERLGGVSGLVTVNIRNSTRGWARRRCVRLNPQSMRMPVA